MRLALPTMTASAEELQQRMQREPDTKKRQRLPALYLAASGQARHRNDMATWLGVHRHSVAAWFDAYAHGGLAQALHSCVSTPPGHRRITDTAVQALHTQRNAPRGFAGYDQIRRWLAEAHPVHVSYASVHALGRYKLHAKPKRPRPSHAKKSPTR